MNSLRSNPWAALFVLCLGLFMIVLDTTIVNIAVPSIIGNLHAGLDEVLWILNAYTLVYTVLLITAGRVGDLLGPRTVFVVGMALFTLASAASGLAPNIGLLIAARVIQGVGAALMTPQTMGIVSRMFPPDRRGAAFGIAGSVMAAGAVAGPSLGGIIVSNWDWRWIFYINVPVGVLALAASFVFVPSFKSAGRQHLDAVGMALASVGLSAVVFGLVEGQRYNWGSLWAGVTIPELIAAGVLALAAFLVWERSTRDPLMPLSLFADRNFSVMSAVIAMTAFAILGLLLVMTMYLQSVLNMTPLDAGLTLVAMSGAAFITAPIAGRMTDKTGGKYIVLAAMVAFATSIALIAWLAGQRSPAWIFAGPLVLGGLGLAGLNAPTLTIGLRNVSPQAAGTAAGVMNTIRQFGFVLGGAVSGAVLQTQFAAALHAQTAAYASQVGPGARRLFINGAQTLSQGGLDLSVKAGGVQFPNVSPPVADQLQTTLHNLLVSSFVHAIGPTLIVSSVLLLITAGATLAFVQTRRERVGAEVPELEAGDSIDQCCLA